MTDVQIKAVRCAGNEDVRWPHSEQYPNGFHLNMPFIIVDVFLSTHRPSPSRRAVLFNEDLELKIIEINILLTYIREDLRDYEIS